MPVRRPTGVAVGDRVDGAEKGELFRVSGFRVSGFGSTVVRFNCGAGWRDVRSGDVRSGDQAVAHAEGDGVSAVVRAESSEQSAGVGFHGVHGQEQLTTDFPVGLAAADSPQDLQFSFGGWVWPDVGAGPRGGGGLRSDGLTWWP